MLIGRGPGIETDILHTLNLKGGKVLVYNAAFKANKTN